MRTLLINTPYPAAEMPQIPMGLVYIAGLLEREGIEVQVQDFLVQKYTEKKLAEKIAEFAPQIVGANSVTMNYPVASQILRDCKRLDENILTVIGGPHVSFTPQETLQEAPWIDVVVRGEGEYTMLEIAQGEKLEEVNGIALRENNEVVLTPLRGWIEDLDKLPFPARHLFPLTRYQALGGECNLITGRGCPFDCIFCVGHKMIGRKMRLRNPKLVVDEIEDVLGKGFQIINLVDDLFTINKEHVYAFCDEIESRNLKFNWTIFSRVDTVSKELLLRMREAGCFYALYGVESGNQQILDTAKKKITPQKAKEAIELAKEAGIRILASFIIGLPGETKATLEQTVNFARGLDTSYGFHLLSPFPGTELRERAKEYGIKILTDDWLKYDANQPITETEEVTAQMLSEVDREYQAIVRDYIEYVEDLERRGELDEAEVVQLKKRRRGGLVGNLLQEDIIEELGRMKGEGDIVEELAAKISSRMSYPLPQAREVVSELVHEGILKYEMPQGDIVWRWA